MYVLSRACPSCYPHLLVQDLQAPPSTQSHPSPKAKSKSKSKKSSKKQRANKGISIFDIIARIFLLWLTIYTVAVCPEDVELRSPVCRALTEYRRLILEPYVYPPVRAALEHPSIAPTIQRIQPYYNSAIKTTVPIIRRTKYEWRTRVIPQVRWFQIRARPYMRQIHRKYDATLGPYVHKLILEYHHKVGPHVKTLELTALQKWKTVRPYVRPLWRAAKLLPGVVIRMVGKPLGDARRRWVDPHVAKIWDAVMEQEKANVSNVKAFAESIVSQVSITASEKATGWSPFSASTSTSGDVLAATDDASIVRSPTPGIDSTPSASPPENAQEATSEPSATILSVPHDVSVFIEITSSGEATLPPITDEAAASAVSILEETLFQSATGGTSEFPTTASSVSPAAEPTLTEVIAKTAVILDDDESVENLDDFLSEINAIEPDSEAEPEEVLPPQAPVYEEETPEQLAERLRLISIQNAEKRADIERRHTQWEIDLEKLGHAQVKVVQTVLGQLREASAAEAQRPGSVVRSRVDDLAQEAEKSLKSLKAYAKKLAVEDTTEAEKVKAWESVIPKVDKKFGQKVDAAAESVRAWWDLQVQREIGEINTFILKVKDMAFNGQSDIGMDYSWLGDVTYMDWQRYHKLVATADSFEELYMGMQAGTDENAPANPLNEIMEALQEEVDDMIVGFETNLSRIKSAAVDLFAGSDKTSDPTSEAPEVSILPIEPVPLGKMDSIPPVILSRGAEEVKAAIKRADEARTAHEEL
ncbi:hypothetical protein BU17DRAFT_48081 [Hysterangium stoloniferum]|nr:hypothetical protein BU17DRAFT_48081 [Hysterangium stoloniferum]